MHFPIAPERFDGRAETRLAPLPIEGILGGSDFEIRPALYLIRAFECNLARKIASEANIPYDTYKSHI